MRQWCQGQSERYGAAPSLRDIFYAFIDTIWPNTKSAYKQLSRYLVAARKEQKIAWDLIGDGSGRDTTVGDNGYSSPTSYITRVRRMIEHPELFYENKRWRDQPKYVEMWLEKEADFNSVSSLLRDRKVRISYNRGYSGWRFLWDNCRRLSSIDKKTTIHILYLGDFDPSGEDMNRFIQEAISYFGISFQFSKIAITEEQINKYELPHEPTEPEEIQKMKRDPRYKKWKHGLFRVETAALRSRHPDEFDQIVTSSVDDRFDEDVYKQVKKDLDREVNAFKKFARKRKDEINQFFDGWKGSVD